MSRKQQRKPARLENPAMFPHYVYLEPAVSEFDAIVKRGGPYFDALAGAGFEATRVRAGSAGPVKIRGPWTFVFMPVPFEDVTGWVASMTSGGPCSIIMDVQFPVMRMDSLVGPVEAVAEVVNNRDVILANIGAACAVTVPQKEWAADLVEVNPRVWWLPDILIDPGTELAVLDDLDADIDDAVLDDLEDRAGSLEVFGVKFAEICQATFAGCRSDPSTAHPPTS